MCGGNGSETQIGSAARACEMMSAAFPARGRIAHTNGFGWLQRRNTGHAARRERKKRRGERNKRQRQRNGRPGICGRRGTRLTKPETNSGGGVISFPQASMDLPMSKSAMTLAIASHTPASAKSRPGQTLWTCTWRESEYCVRCRAKNWGVELHTVGRIRTQSVAGWRGRLSAGPSLASALAGTSAVRDTR